MRQVSTKHVQPDMPRRGRRRGGLRLRLLGRAGGVAFLAAAVGYAVMLGGHLEGVDARLAKLPGAVAGYFGYAAHDIRISGLKWHSPPAVLEAIAVTPGGPLVGFEPAKARRLLENLDWVKSARVHRLFPNQLEIHIVERQPFAIWQRDGRFHVIDHAGVALSSITAADVPGLPVVTGEGAQSAVAQLVNHMEAHPGLKSKVTAAGRVGARRWNLYLTGAVKVLLPEHGVEKALAVLSDLNNRHRILDKQLGVIDLRVPGRVTFSPPPPGPVSVAGVSQR
jgi:cell division protein FtsQ